MIRLVWSPSRALWLALAASVVLLVGIAWLAQHRSDVDVLPPAVVQAVDAERAARPSIDSAIAQSRYEADLAKADRIAAESRARQLQRAAEIQGRRADSLALEAAHAASARDSAIAWHLAYAARTHERDTLLTTIDTLRHAVTLAEAEARANARGRDLAEAGRRRADSVLDATVRAAVQANCRVRGTFGLVHCPSRPVAFAAGVGVALLARPTYRALKDGRLGVTLPLP